MRSKLWMAIAVLAMCTACGKTGGKGAEAPDGEEGAGEDGAADEGGGAQIAEGTKVCISGFVGVRYQLKDAITERGLEMAQDCMFADIEVAEEGDTGAWVLKHREVGGDWKECKSSAEDRTEFINECFGAMGAPSRQIQ